MYVNVCMYVLYQWYLARYSIVRNKNLSRTITYHGTRVRTYVRTFSSTVVVMISLSRTQWMQFQSVAKSSFASQHLCACV